MGFKDELDALEQARLAREHATATEINAIHSSAGDAVVSEIVQALTDAVEFLVRRPAPQGYLVMHDPQGAHPAPKPRMFRSPPSAQPYPNSRIAGRFWLLEHGLVLTGSAQLLAVRVWGDSYVPPEIASVAGKLRIPEGSRYVLLTPGEERHTLSTSQLIVANSSEWEPNQFRSTRFWTTRNRERYRAILGSPERQPADSKRSGFGITPDGKAGVVDVHEAGRGTDSNPFGMTIYQFDTWLAQVVQRIATGP